MVKANPLYPRERPGTHCIGPCVSHRAGLDRGEKSHPHRNSTPASSNPLRVAIPTEQNRLTALYVYVYVIVIVYVYVYV